MLEPLTKYVPFLGALSSLLFFIHLSSAAVLDFYGDVRLTNSAGLMRPAGDLMKEDIREVAIDGKGGILWSTDSVMISLESTGSHGARLELGAMDTWTLDEGFLDVTSKFPVTVLMDNSGVSVLGRAVFRNISGMESQMGIFKGSAEGRAAGRKLKLTPLDAFRITGDNRPSIERLLPPPEVISPPGYSSVPLVLTVALANEKIRVGAILVEVTKNKNFWGSSARFLFQPDDPVILTELADGPLFFRVSTMNRSGMAGPPSPTFKTWVVNGGPVLSLNPVLQTDVISGQLVPALSGIPVRWHNLRARTDENGGFEFKPAQTFGLTVSDFDVEFAGTTRHLQEPLVYLSDPDHLSYVSPIPEEPQKSTLFIKSQMIRLSNASSKIKMKVDGIPVIAAETEIAVPPAIRRTIRIDYGDTPYEVSILQDVEGPKILNVSLETRGPSERFYVFADVLDLGIGLQLPAKATFENEAGDRLDVPLEKISEIRLEGRAGTEVYQRKQSRVWWVRVEASDLLGNITRFEKAVYHKRQKKFQVVGFKDLVKIWKKKL